VQTALFKDPVRAAQ